MKYNININQLAVIREGFDLDIIDMAIFDYILFLGSSPKTIRTKDYNGKEFFRVRHKTIIENMPLLGIKSEQAIQRRIEKLIQERLLEKYLQEGNRTFYCFGENFDKLFIENKENMVVGRYEGGRMTIRGGSYDDTTHRIYNKNNINNNVINNITEETSDFSQTYYLNNLEEETNGSSMVAFEEERKEKSSAKKEKKEDPRDKDVQEVIDEIRHTLEENNLIYQHDGYERVFAKHIATAKEFGNTAEKFGMSRIEFAKNIIILSTNSDFWNGKIYNAKTIYKHYAKVLNDGRNTFENSKPKYDYNLNNLV